MDMTVSYSIEVFILFHSCQPLGAQSLFGKFDKHVLNRKIYLITCVLFRYVTRLL